MDLFRTDTPTTILAGAGVSAVAPTCLPGWWSLNDSVLQTLGDAVERVTGRSGLSSDFRNVVVARRDSTPFLKPDLQAQLIEDEIGDAYFSALAHVDSVFVNSTHELIAEVARQGRVGAIITTNFDCTIERALDKGGVNYVSYASPEEFEGLASHSIGVALVKVHGSSNRPSTMVDTLRQRLHGRPASLNTWMQSQFVKFPTMAMGFSGEDLGYDENYLTIRPSVIEGAQFQFLVRDEQPSAPLAKLRNEFPERVLLKRGELPGWFFDVVRSGKINHSVSLPVSYSEQQIKEYRSRATRSLETGLNQWGSSLSRIEVINAVTALLSSAGQRPAADQLLERTWSFYREASDCDGPAYARYLYNYGETLMRGARFRNPYNRETDFGSWKSAADKDPGQFFVRAMEYGETEAALSRAVLSRFLSGAQISSIEPAISSLLEQLTQAGADENMLSLIHIDASFSLAEVLELCALGQAGTGILESSYRSAARHGDEFRLAEAAWRLARNLSFGLDANSANAQRVNELAQECTAIAIRLNIRESDAGAALARSIAAIARHAWDEAASEAKRAEDIYAELDDLLGISFSKRERVRALIGQGLAGGQTKGADFDELSEWLQRFAMENAPGLRPIIKLELALLANYFDDSLTAELAADAAEGAALQGHPYIGDKARDLLQSLKSD